MSKISPSELPPSSEGWHCVIRRLNTWIVPDEDENSRPIRPHLLAAINQSTGMVHGTSIGPELSPQDALDLLFKFMTEPEKETHASPQRPARMLFEDQKWLKALSPALREIGIECRYRAHPPHLDDLLQELEEHIGGGGMVLPGLLSQRGVTPKLAGGVFSAAAAFYRAEPWVTLANEDILALQMPGEKQPRFVTVMGQGGMEYGLVRYDTWNDVLRQYTPHSTPEEGLSPKGHHVFFFNEITHTSFRDLDDAERYGWEAVDNDLHPVPMVVFPGGQVRRPAGNDLQWYEAALRAIPVFVSDHLEVDVAGFPVKGEAVVAVNTSSGPVRVSVRYAAGDLPDELRHGKSFLTEMDDDESDDEPFGGLPFDPRAIERMIALKHREMGAERLVSEAVEQAQEVMYQAWGEQSPGKRLELARQALNISPDCADAYVMLAEEKAGDAKTALRYYQDGVEAGRRALPSEVFDEHTGSLWLILEARPFMRSLRGVGDSLKELRRSEEALAVYREVVRLNTGDNQGVRYNLADLLLEMKKHVDLRALLDEYGGDTTAVWLYTRALLAYREAGDKPAARKEAKKAMKANPYVLPYLLGKERIPGELPRMMGIGDENEAVMYASGHLIHWRRTPGAVEWLAAQPQPKAAAKKKPKHRFGVGDFVKVRPGIRDEDSDAPMSGWVGEVIELDDDKQPTVLVAWDAQTLKNMPEAFIVATSEYGEDWDSMYMLESDLLPTSRRDTREERDAVVKQLDEQYAWAYLGEQGKRLREILAGVSLEEVRLALQTWEKYLHREMKLPLPALLEETHDRHFKEDDQVEIISFEPGFDEEDGLSVRVRKGKHEMVLPLYELYPADDETPAGQAMDDYLAWMDSR